MNFSDDKLGWCKNGMKLNDVVYIIAKSDKRQCVTHSSGRELVKR